MRAASEFSDETHDSSDLNQYGDYAGLAAAAGVAHPLWTDSRDVALREEIYATAIRAATLRAHGR